MKHNSEDTYTPMFIAALFTRARTWKQPRYPTTDEWMKLWYLPAIFLPACASFSPAFQMMYSAYKLNQQGDNIKP